MGSQRDLLSRPHRSAHSARLAAVRARKEFKNFRLVPINSVEGMGGLQLDGGGIDFSNRYFRSADLCGVDFSTSRLRASASIAQRYPAPRYTEEIALSIQYRTRMRYRR